MDSGANALVVREKRVWVWMFWLTYPLFVGATGHTVWRL